MNICYHQHYNVNLGLFNAIHPFDGLKFQKIYNAIKSKQGIDFIEPLEPVSMNIVDEFVSETMQKNVRNKALVMQALEVPNIPLLSFSFIDRKVLTPMRWGIAGTIQSAIHALENQDICWNISGGYHHATPKQMQGFCIYNDIGICHQQLVKQGLLSPTDKILIIDIDAHHGNGNALTFMENDNVTIVDVYNADIYPNDRFSRQRVNIPVPLPMGSSGNTYLSEYSKALDSLNSDYQLAFVVAGTDILSSDKLGGFKLHISDVIKREKATIERLKGLEIPTVLLGGGGYSKDSAVCVTESIMACTT